MKRHITFPFSRLIFKAYMLVLLLLFAGLSHASAFFPEAASRLTIFDNHQQVYLSRCPKLSPVKQIYQEDEKKLPLPFTLLNWNIYKQQKKRWQQKLQEWTASADLLTLQEVKYSPELNNFSEVNNLFYFQNYAFKYKGFVYGVNTQSKNQARFVCGTRYNEPWIMVPKTGLASSYAITNNPDLLLLINLHGVNFTLTSTPLAEQIQPYLDLIKTHQGPVIFSGDFNTWSDARLVSIEERLIKSGFNEALFNKDQRVTTFGHALDHIYFRGLKVIKAESLATEASDHSPQLVTFDIE